MTDPNGGWPDLPTEPPSLKELPTGASTREILDAYATAFLAFAPLWRKSTHALQFLYGRAMGMTTSLARIERHLGIAQTSPLPPMRDPESSYHDFDEPLRKARQSLREKVNSAHHPISESSALKLVEETVARLNAATELTTWRRIKALGPLIGREALKALATLIVGGTVVELLHLFRVLAH